MEADPLRQPGVGGGAPGAATITPPPAPAVTRCRLAGSTSSSAIRSMSRQSCHVPALARSLWRRMPTGRNPTLVCSGRRRRCPSTARGRFLTLAWRVVRCLCVFGRTLRSRLLPPSCWYRCWYAEQETIDLLLLSSPDTSDDRRRQHLPKAVALAAKVSLIQARRQPGPGGDHFEALSRDRIQGSGDRRV